MPPRLQYARAAAPFQAQAAAASPRLAIEDLRQAQVGHQTELKSRDELGADSRDRAAAQSILNQTTTIGTSRNEHPTPHDLAEHSAPGERSPRSLAGRAQPYPPKVNPIRGSFLQFDSRGSGRLLDISKGIICSPQYLFQFSMTDRSRQEQVSNPVTAQDPGQSNSCTNSKRVLVRGPPSLGQDSTEEKGGES